MRTRIKICGITSTEIARSAVDAGVDALGFNMVSRSVRFVTPELTAGLIASLPPFVTTVGLFADHSADEVEEICGSCRFDLLQFHGSEDNAFCSQFETPFVKAIGVDGETDIGEEVAQFPDSMGILLDSRVAGRSGGTGVTFDWHRIPEMGQKVILAGGLDPENVGAAISQIRPYAVDVSGGVERVPGEKNVRMIEAFVHSVRQADTENEEIP